MEQAVFFVHIPKTAGTSFRKSIEENISLDGVLYDYSPNSMETSEAVINHIYENKDFLKFYDYIFDNDKYFLSGHMPAMKYVHGFGVKQVVTFLRNPVQRIISEYHHFVRNYDYKKTFEDFYRSPQFINRHCKMLESIPIQALGFFGLTEFYESSILQFNAAYGFDLEVVELNKGREDSNKPYDLSKESLVEIEKLNKQDLDLYNHACAIFRNRQLLFEKGLPYAHAMIQQSSINSISGWAWWHDSDSPVTINIYVNEVFVGETESTMLRPGMLRFSPPRLGYVGFHFNFAKPLKPGDIIYCEVAKTEQFIDKVIIEKSS